MSEQPKQIGDKKPDDNRPEDPSHPGMSPDPAERGKELGEENAYGGQCVGTGGHGASNGGAVSSQPVGGYNVSDLSKFTEEELHPGMNPDPAERGRQLGEENAHGGHSIGTGGHSVGKNGHSVGKDGHSFDTSGHSDGCGCTGSGQPVGGYHASDSSKFSQEQLHPGMNPDPAERGRQLGEENAHGGHCVGTGGHSVGKNGHSVGKGKHGN